MNEPTPPASNEPVVTRGLHGDEGLRAVVYLRVSTAQQAATDRDAEGFSIPAQREACARKAASLGAVVVDEYLDKGESARSADRPALQAMITRLLERRDIDLVIVHKVDRLARSRSDDVAINLAIQKAGAKLVSVSENIDETPSGLLLHGIMSSIAEFYSQNLGAEALKGMTQKAKKGGTPGKPALGYLNVREIVDSREIRTVAVDPDRADHIRWAFDRYARGDISVASLADELTERGLVTRGSARWPARPVGASDVSFFLRNPYYIGIVRFNGAEYTGSHDPLIDLDTFTRVQTLLTTRRIGEKQRRHLHYLRGTIFCGRCGSRMCFSRNRSRNGDYHDYFFCLGRQQKRNDCDLPYLRADEIEAQVGELYRSMRLSTARQEQIRVVLKRHLQKRTSQASKTVATQTKRIERLNAERQRLVQAYVADALPLDLLKGEQDRITRELAEADTLLNAGSAAQTLVLDNLEVAMDLLKDPQAAYRRAAGTERRLWNQAVFDKVLVDTADAPTRSEVTELVGHLLGEALVEEAEEETKNPGPVSRDRGSKEALMVGRVGFEPT